MKEERTPTLFQDIGTIARLYGNVFWMLGQRLQRGPGWEAKLTEDTLRSQGWDTERDFVTPAHRHN
jgi:hypothetical protein